MRLLWATWYKPIRNHNQINLFCFIVKLCWQNLASPKIQFFPLPPLQSKTRRVSSFSLPRPTTQFSALLFLIWPFPWHCLFAQIPKVFSTYHYSCTMWDCFLSTRKEVKCTHFFILEIVLSTELLCSPLFMSEQDSFSSSSFSLRFPMFNILFFFHFSQTLWKWTILGHLWNYKRPSWGVWM